MDEVASRPWELKGQIYLGSETFIDKHVAANKDLKEIPRLQLRAAKPSLERIFAKSGKRAIAEAYDHGYRLHEIAAHLGVHHGRVSRRLKEIEANELTDVAPQDLTPSHRPDMRKRPWLPLLRRKAKFPFLQ